jgi:hypothetical protein
VATNPKAKADVPLCWHCGRPLERHVEVVSKRTLSGTFIVPKVGATMCGAVIREVNRAPHFLQSMPIYHVWFGEYGHKGDGTFCSQLCGYHFALAFTSRAAEALAAKERGTARGDR